MVFVGLNGSGKIIFVKYFNGFFKFFKGRVFVDGFDIREYIVVEFSRFVGYVF